MVKGSARHKSRSLKRSGPKALSILIADDEPLVRDLYAEPLERRGHRVLHAGDGVEAIEHLQKGRVNVLVLDMMMPNIDGKHLLELIEQSNIATRVLVVSSLGQADIIEDALFSGADYYLVKSDSTPRDVVRVTEMLADM